MAALWPNTVPKVYVANHMTKPGETDDYARRSPGRCAITIGSTSSTTSVFNRRRSPTARNSTNMKDRVRSSQRRQPWTLRTRIVPSIAATRLAIRRSIALWVLRG